LFRAPLSLLKIIVRNADNSFYFDTFTKSNLLFPKGLALHPIGN
jgi:hypothetical protein